MMIPLMEMRMKEKKVFMGRGEDAITGGYIESEVSLIHSCERNGG